MNKTHDYIHHYRGYWSDGGRCRIRIYQEDGHIPVVICSQLPDNDNTSVTNMAEYLAAEVMEKHKLPTPLVWIEHYPEHEGEIGECSLVRFSSWEPTEVCLGSVWRHRIGSPAWSPLRPEEEAQAVLGVHHISGGADAPEEDHRPDSRSGACFVWVHRRRT